MASRNYVSVQEHEKGESSKLASQPVASARYRYTVDGFGCMTDEQRWFYEENGFLVIKKLVPSYEIEMYKTRFREICNQQVKIKNMVVMKDVSIAADRRISGEKDVTKVQGFYDDPVLFNYCHNPTILRYVESIVGPDIMSVHNMLINKPPDTGKKTSRHPLHQDLHYFLFRPEDRICASWTAMEHVDRSNGCLVVQPGSHKKGKLLEHAYPKWEGGVNKMYFGIVDFDPDAPRVHLVMEEGDTVFFHPLLIHGSGTNTTNGFRKAISGHFASSSCKYISVDDPLHAPFVKEASKIAQRKAGVDLQTSAQRRYRLVQGKRSNL